MRVSREVMAQRHDEIIDQTSKMLRQRGILGTSLADLMAAAGLTHGGFYKHFDSKEALVAEATQRIFAEYNFRFENRGKTMGPKGALKAYVADYLTQAHVKNPDIGCPIPSFGADAGRETDGIKDVFTAGMTALLDHIMAGLSCPPAERKARSIELLSLLTGAMLMARASNDKQLTAEIIESAQQTANKLIDARR